MKKMMVLRQIWKICTMIMAFATGSSLFIICRSKKVTKKYVDGKPVLLIELEEEKVSMFGMKDGKIDGTDLLRGINNIRLSK